MKLRALERKDLPFVHELDNSRQVMAFWFEEPYESLDEMYSLYDKHIHDSSERRFVIDVDGEFAGVLELMNIDFIHRNCEIQIIVSEEFRGQKLAQKAFTRGIEYTFNMLNMHKVYLYVDVENESAVHIYTKLGFKKEGYLREQFFAEGRYHDSHMMSILKSEVNLGELSTLRELD